MALSLVQHKVAQTTASQVTVPVTITSTGAGRLLVAVCANAGTRTTTGVSATGGAGSDTFTQAPSSAATQATHAVDVWYFLSSTSGRTTVTATFSGAAGTFNKEIWVFEVSGFASTPSIDIVGVVNSGSQSGNDYNGPSITTTGTNDFIVAGCVVSNNVNVNPKAGNEFTTGGDISATNDAACSLITTTAGVHQAAWHDNSAVAASYCATCVAFKDGAGTAPISILSVNVNQSVRRASYY